MSHPEIMNPSIVRALLAIAVLCMIIVVIFSALAFWGDPAKHTAFGRCAFAFVIPTVFAAGTVLIYDKEDDHGEEH